MATNGEAVRTSSATPPTSARLSQQPNPAPSGGAAEGEASREQPLSFPEAQTMVVYGPSGYGRSRLLQKLIYSEPSLYALTVLHTSRRRRLYEVEGRELSFVTQAEMVAGIEGGRFAAHAKVTREQSPRFGDEGWGGGGSGAGLARSTSIYDLAEKDRSEGEYFGISHEALRAAREAGKPVAIVNTNPSGAKQLKGAGLRGLYVLLHPGTSPSSSSVADDVGADCKVCIDQHEEAMKALEELVRGKLLRNVDVEQTMYTDEGGDSAKAVEQARLDWELVPTLPMSAAPEAGEIDDLRKTVSFVEVLEHVQHVTLMQRTGSRRAGTKIGPAPGPSRSPRQYSSKISKSLQSEYATFCACSETGLDDSNPVHLLTLQTIYKRLTGNRVNCPRIGSHWRAIGFQSSDPADDLLREGVGFLALLQLLFLVDCPRTLPWAQAMRSHLATCSGIGGGGGGGGGGVPFCALSVRATQLALGGLGEESLRKECNRRDQVFQVLNELYLGVMSRCYQLCRKGVVPSGKKKARVVVGGTPPELGGLVAEVGRVLSRGGSGGVRALLRDGRVLVAGEATPPPARLEVSVAPLDSFSQL